MEVNLGPSGEGSTDAQKALAAQLEVVDRLRREEAPPSEWRREALSRYEDGREAEAGQILQAAVDASNLHGPRCSGADRVANMYMLAEFHLSRAISWPTPPLNELEDLLNKASALLNEAESLDTNLGISAGVEAFVAKGFHAIARRVLKCNPQGDELKRAEIVFDAALKMDGSSPRALLGKAIVLAEHKEWAKALVNFRQVLKRAAPPAPKSGLRLMALKQLRFAIATCFCNLGRFKQTHNALSSVVAADPSDVESFCALAHLEAKLAKDGVGRSLEFLHTAVQVNKDHPVVLIQLANHAFNCGLEARQRDQGLNSESAPFGLARNLLRRALELARAFRVRAEIHYQLGRLEHAEGNYPAANEEYSKCHALLPEHLACMYAIAQTCVQQQKYQEGIAMLEALKKLRGQSVEVLKLLTYSYLMAGDHAAEAVKCADALVAKSKDDMEAWAMRAEAQDQLSVSQPTSAVQKVGMEAYEQVARLLQNNNGSDQTGASPQMWNNLGTLRGLHGDPKGAKEAFGRGIEMAERRLAGEGAGPNTMEEAKDLHIARLTMRFNRAWIAESQGDQPDYMQATQDYMAINEEHNWYVDSLLQLGQQWQRMGETDMAVQRYQEAMKQNPVLGSLMQAQLFRAQLEYSKAVQSAEMAVQCAGEKQFHYVHVFLGNLYFEIAGSASTKQRDRDAYMHKALWNYTKALEHKKDSHYAANGIGMVFARRGKMDFARRTFQSVMQHHAMSGDPSVFINLGHTYLEEGGDSARKAIALYERAKKLRPDDLKIRLYLSKAHFKLKEFDRCIGILGDATQTWPDDLFLRYNLAIALENFGVNLVSEEKKIKRVVGVDNGVNQMNHAVQLLGSAARLFDYVHHQWATAMTDEERKTMVETSGASDLSMGDQMQSANAHKDYCYDIQAKAKDELDTLQAKKVELDRRIQENAGNMEEEQRRQQEQQEAASSTNVQAEEDNDRAKDLEEKAKGLDLGKDLAGRAEAPRKQPERNKGGSQAKEKPEKPPKPGKVKAPFQGGGGDLDPDRKEKKDKKDKKDKKEKKREKKEKKREKKRERGEAVSDDDASDAESKGSKGSKDDGEEGLEGDVAPKADKADGDIDLNDVFGEDDNDNDDAKEKKKKDKKDKKKKKKDKKDKKAKKRRKTEDSGESEEAKNNEEEDEEENVPTEGSGGVEDGGEDAQDDAMEPDEEDLFGPMK